MSGLKGASVFSQFLFLCTLECTHTHTLSVLKTTHSLALTFPTPHIPSHHSFLLRKRKKRVQSYFKFPFCKMFSCWSIIHPSLCFSELVVNSAGFFFFFFCLIQHFVVGSKQLGLCRVSAVAAAEVIV